MKPYVSMLKKNDNTRELVYSVIKEPMDDKIHKEKYGAFFVHDVTKPFTDEEREVIFQADCVYSEIAWETESGDYWREMKEKHGDDIPNYDKYIEGISSIIFEFIYNANKPVIIVSNKKNMNKFVKMALFSRVQTQNITILESKILGARCYVGFFNISKHKTALDNADVDKITDHLPLEDYPDIFVEGFIKLEDMRFWIYTTMSSVYDFSCGVGNSFGEFKKDMLNTCRTNYAIGSDINPTFTEFCRRFWGMEEYELMP